MHISACTKIGFCWRAFSSRALALALMAGWRFGVT